MKVNIQKWGNSLALRIPRSFALETHIKQNSEVDIFLKDGKIIVSSTSKKSYTLKNLLSKVSSKNLHKEIDTGFVKGREVW